ncbi:ABC-2 type transport system permease protein [Microbacterium resistens]|uniref:ABC-2 type transport system permease protein n=1 Tax=Microbacterium resistens TaxID=156977 RepID=A0ABU1SE83_9MICO|nr:ABC transporter permease [Microbacterium resistens]MDR6867920.1 ABC-2 type transport system permease protein [Microbacterium resistens]
MTTNILAFDAIGVSKAKESPSTGRETWLVIRREVLTRLTNRTIRFATAVLSLGLGVGLYFAGRALHDFVGTVGTMNFRPETFFPVAMVVILMTALVYSSSSLTSGVVEEKQSRVVEILLTKIGVAPLVAGKVIGIGLVTLAQLVLIGGSGAVGFTLADGWAALDVDAPLPLLGWLLLWFLLGYAIYAFLNTILASTVARQEDLGTALMPLNILQMVMVGVSLWAGLSAERESTWFHALSFVPLFSSYLMPMRLGMGDAPTLELVAAGGIAAITIPLLFWMTARVYRNTALRTGSRLSLLNALTPTDSKGSTMTDTRSIDAKAVRKRKLIWMTLQIVAGAVIAYAVIGLFF